MGLTIEQALQQGVAAHKEGKLQEAERLYRALLQSQPLHPDANHNLGVLAVSVNKVDAALPLFKTALKANPKIEQFWLSYIDALIKEKHFDNAKQVIEQAKKHGVDAARLNSLEVQLLLPTQKPNTARVNPPKELLKSLLEHYQNGQFSVAEKLSIEITQDFPQHQFAWKVLGAVLGETGRKSEAIDANQTAVQIVPQDADGHGNLGVTLQELGRLGEAQVSYKKAIVLKPSYNQSYYNLGITLGELEELENAKARFTQALVLEPNYAKAHYNLAIMSRELGRLEEAKASYKQAIELKPDYAEGHNNLGVALQELGKLNEAEASYKQAIKLKPDFVEAHNNLGATLQVLGKLEEAEASYRRAIALKSDFAGAYDNLGVTLQTLSRSEEAEASYRRAIALKSDFFEAFSHLGVTLNEIGRLEEAEASCRKSILFKPDFAAAYDNLAFVLRGLHRLDEAEASLFKAISLKPDFAEAHNNLGLTFKKYGKLDLSMEFFRKAINLNPDLVEARINLNSVSNSAVPPWHISMMNDKARNEAYSDAIQLAVDESSFVLEIGTGAGLLSLMAASNGAGRVITCETSKTIADNAREIIENNGYRTKISVINKKSTDLIVGKDLPEKADLIISEVLSAEFVGEGVRTTLVDANRRLLKDGGKIIPQSGKIKVSLIGNSPEFSDLIIAQSSQGFDLSNFNLISQQKFSLELKNKPVFLSDPKDAFNINLYDTSTVTKEQKSITLKANSDGVCIGLIQWLWVHLYGDIEYENKPGEIISHWPTPIYLFEEPIDLKKGDIVEVRAFLGEDSVWFYKKATNLL